MKFNGEELDVIQLLGGGKGGYSYLVNYEGRQCVLKKFHNEEVSYYTFSSPKLELELRDYQRLKDAGILIPELYLTDSENQMLLKQYIPGPTCFKLVKNGLMSDEIVSLVRAMFDVLPRASPWESGHGNDGCTPKGVLHRLWPARPVRPRLIV